MRGPDVFLAIWLAGWVGLVASSLFGKAPDLAGIALVVGAFWPLLLVLWPVDYLESGGE